VLSTSVHLCALHPISVTHLTFVFPSLANDKYIIGLASDVLLVFMQLQEKFGVLGLSMQPTKCVTWSPHGLNQSISLILGFLTLGSSFHILGAPMGICPFVESFVLEVF
jgi:hypothetical protein